MVRLSPCLLLKQRELYSNSVILLRAEDVFSRLFAGIYGALL